MYSGSLIFITQPTHHLLGFVYFPNKKKLKKLSPRISNHGQKHPSQVHI